VSPRNRRPGRSAKSAKSARRRGRSEQPREDEGTDLFAEIGEILSADDSLALLLMASHQIGVTDPQLLATLQEDFEVPTLEAFEELLLRAPQEESSALLAALAVLSGDGERRKRAYQEIADRAHPLPRWLAELPATEAEPRAIELPDPFGDGETLLVSVTLPGGHPLTAIVVVDHDLGTAVADGHILPLTLDQVVRTATSSASDDDEDPAPRPIEPADARARVTEAVQQGSLIDPPVVTERWPFSRALLEWMISLLPEGGTGYRWPSRDGVALDDLVERFRASEYAVGVEDAGNLLPRVLGFLAGRPPHDPLRVSPASVAVVYGWISEDVVAPVDELAAVPDLLRAYARFAHHERGLPAAMTEETLAALDEYDAQYRKLISGR
jgi:hypothetical protein